MELTSHLTLAIKAAQKAAVEILDVYGSADFGVEAKGDLSPLTIADKRAHHVIAEVLSETGLPVLSEEGKIIPFEERTQWEYFWMVDPLDGTKEFVKRNGDFTVNIALIHKGAPVLGVVNVPVSGDTYYADANQAFVIRGDETIALSRRSHPDLNVSGLRVVASRSHLSEETQKFIDGLREPVLLSRGSSLKFMLLAEGLADLYPRYAPTMEWDTAAAHAIINAVGLHVVDTTHQLPLSYNKRDLLNPFFIVG